MTRNVLIATRGIQFLAGSDPDEPIEIMTVGTYRKIGDKKPCDRDAYLC